MIDLLKIDLIWDGDWGGVSPSSSGPMNSPSKSTIKWGPTTSDLLCMKSCKSGTFAFSLKNMTSAKVIKMQGRDRREKER